MATTPLTHVGQTQRPEDATHQQRQQAPPPARRSHPPQQQKAGFAPRAHPAPGANAPSDNHPNDE